MGIHPNQNTEKIGCFHFLQVPELREFKIKTKKTFAKHAVQDIDDSWTKSPSNSNKPAREKTKSVQKPEILQKQPTKNTGPSLLELHQQKLAKKSEQGREEPKRWDRERDFLGVGKTMSNSDREKIIKGAANLHS